MSTRMIDTKHLDQLLTQYQLEPNTAQAQHILEYTIRLVSQGCDRGIDIGCGQNWLRTVAACDIIGVDQGGVSAMWRDEDRTLHPARADVIASLGDQWFESHQAQFDCAFALCSIHHRTFDQIVPAIDQVMQMCTKRAYITMNSRRIVDQGYAHFVSTGDKVKIHRNKKFLDSIGSDTHDFQQNFLDWLVSHVGYDIDITWLFTHDGKDAGNEGDIHMVLSHNNHQS